MICSSTDLEPRAATARLDHRGSAKARRPISNFDREELAASLAAFRSDD
jgi:hypothetical protein